MALDKETKKALNDKDVQQRIVHTKIKPGGKHISLNLSDHLMAKDTSRDERRPLQGKQQSLQSQETRRTYYPGQRVP